MRPLQILFFIIINIPLGITQNYNAMQTPFEKDNNYSASYKEIVSYYEELSKINNHIHVNNFGMTDIGEPLQEVIIDKDGLTNPEDVRAAGKAILFINNGIHPGEPCGIDASMMFVRDINSNEALWKAMDEISIVLIPVYNIGGALNRTSYSRANQVGPKSYGFRGNAKNYDLNRDFVKCDSKNAQSFNQMFTKWSPDLFIDNHTSNGADYQYTLTLIATQKDKLSPSLGEFLDKTLEPALYKAMEDTYPMIPYVDMLGKTPEEGITSFVDYGRYSSGYAAMHHTIGFMPETHMLKSFKERVESTCTFLKEALQILAQEKTNLLEARHKAFNEFEQNEKAAITWEMTSEAEDLEFNGFEAGYKESEISGIDRLFYDRSKPYTKTISYYKHAEISMEVDKPKQYIIPQAYTDIIERLEWNGVKMNRLDMHQEMEVEVYYIDDYDTTSDPYEGHYLHSNVKVSTKTLLKQYRKGDYIVDVNQESARYIMETLEPQAPDSYFNWNFMDAFLQQKEHFSPYVFEDSAAEFLKKNPKIKSELEERKSTDEKFAANSYAQLLFVYKKSPYYETTHRQYPIARIK